jgi:hypothetical protein
LWLAVTVLVSVTVLVGAACVVIVVVEEVLVLTVVSGADVFVGEGGCCGAPAAVLVAKYERGPECGRRSQGEDSDGDD